VDDSIWREVSPSKCWLTAPASDGPYGWEWVNPSGNDTKSLEGIRIQNHMVGNGPFDENPH
jgi:hypothetical protein